jgi:hypothetical protein
MVRTNFHMRCSEANAPVEKWHYEFKQIRHIICFTALIDGSQHTFKEKRCYVSYLFFLFSIRFVNKLKIVFCEGAK